jgi:hypothetical protein
LGFDNHNPVRREAVPANPRTFYNYCVSGLVQSSLPLAARSVLAPTTTFHIGDSAGIVVEIATS